MIYARISNIHLPAMYSNGTSQREYTYGQKGNPPETSIKHQIDNQVKYKPITFRVDHKLRLASKASEIRQNNEANIFRHKPRFLTQVSSKLIIIQSCLILLSFGELLSSLSISPPTKEPTLARLGRTTIDDDELSRTMDRNGPGQGEDDPISAIDLARTRDQLGMMGEDSNRIKISERLDDNSTSTTTTSIQSIKSASNGDVITVSSTNEEGQLPSNLHITSVALAPGERAQVGSISVINNQSSTVHLGDGQKAQLNENNESNSDAINNNTKPKSEESSLEEGLVGINSVELLHNVAMNEPSDMIQSQALGPSALTVGNDTEVVVVVSENDNENQQINLQQKPYGGHDKRESRRRKTAGSDPAKENRSGDSRGSIKSVISRPKQLPADQQVAIGPKFGLASKQMASGKASQQPRPEGGEVSTNRPGSHDELMSIQSSKLNESRNSSKIQNNVSSTDPRTVLKGAATGEMRAFESATVETTASNNNNNNNIDQGQNSNADEAASDDDDSQDMAQLINNGITTTEAPGEDTSIQGSNSHANNKVKFITDEKSLAKPIKIDKNKQDQQVKSFRTTHHELLVGPFKSEKDAPDTITLAGVVYIKSNSSSHSGLVSPILDPSQALQQATMVGQNRPESTPLGPANLKALSSSPQQVINSDLNEALRLINLEQGKFDIKYGKTTSTGQLAPNNLQATAMLGSTSIQHNKWQHQARNQAKGQSAKHQANQWTPHSLPGGAQLFLPISQAQLISLLGQPGKLITSASQTLAQAASASSKPKDKSKYSITLTSIPTGESILSTLASTLDFKLADPMASLSEGKQHLGAASASTLQQIGIPTPTNNNNNHNNHNNDNQDSSDWAQLAASSAAATSTAPISPATTTSGQSNEASAEQLYLNSLLQASSSSASNPFEAMAASNGSKEHKTQPVVIVEKNVKPVKYHLLRAYLKLRRLLRPGDATYVFPAV